MEGIDVNLDNDPPQDVIDVKRIWTLRKRMQSYRESGYWRKMREKLAFYCLACKISRIQKNNEGAMEDQGDCRKKPAMKIMQDG